MCHHEADFGVKAEWHFSATSHGKGASDGLGCTVKSLAGKASLQRPYDRQITTPMQLFQWVSQEIQGITFEYCSIKEHKEEEQRLQDRFQNTNYKVQHVVLFPSPKIPFELRRIPFQMISKIKKLPRKPLWKHHQGLLPVYVIVNGGSLMF